MRIVRIVAIAVAIVVGYGGSARAEVLGSAYADGSGAGEIKFNVSPEVDAQFIADQIAANAELTEAGQIASVNVQDGVATITFSSANPTALVEAIISDDIAAAILSGAGAPTIAGGGSSVGLAVLGAAALGGAGFGIYKAVDGGDDDDGVSTDPGTGGAGGTGGTGGAGGTGGSGGSSGGGGRGGSGGGGSGGTPQTTIE